MLLDGENLDITLIDFCKGYPLLGRVSNGPPLNFKAAQALSYIAIIGLQWPKKIQPTSAFHIGQKKE